MTPSFTDKNLISTGVAKPKVNTAVIAMGEIPSVKIAPEIRVGSVPYLNAKPLTRFISSPFTKVEPVQLAADLRADKLDVALVPVMEVLEAPADLYRIVDGIAIGSEREVFSVYINYKVPLAKISSVTLDPASKTSVELARIVLEKFHRLTPRYVSTGEPADAQVIIGDPAILHRQAHPEQNYLDLATAWREHTTLPFVFAVWAVRLPYWKARSVAGQLRSAGKLGLSWRDAIARTPFERQYLTEHLCYDLGDRQKKAIALFGKMLTESGRLASEPKVSYI
jgi:chorismate dehydratase